LESAARLRPQMYLDRPSRSRRTGRGLGVPGGGGKSENGVESPAMTQEEKPLLVLDAGKVLVDFDLAAAVDALSELRGEPLSLPLPSHLEKVFHEAELSPPAWRATTAALNEEYGLDLTCDGWASIWCRIFRGEVQGMRELISELKETFRIVALSNTCQLHWEYVTENYPIFKLLDGWVVSYEVGAAKPQEEIYHALMEEYGGGKPPFLYVDDMPLFVEGARKVGWDAVLFRGAEELRGEIASRL